MPPHMPNLVEEDEPGSCAEHSISNAMSSTMKGDSSPALQCLILQLNEIRAPRIIMQLVILVFHSPGADLSEDIDCAEYFAGCMAAAWIKKSHTCCISFGFGIQRSACNRFPSDSE